MTDQLFAGKKRRSSKREARALEDATEKVGTAISRIIDAQRSIQAAINSLRTGEAIVASYGLTEAAELIRAQRLLVANGAPIDPLYQLEPGLLDLRTKLQADQGQE